MIVAPGLMHMTDALKAALAATGAQILLGPRSGARDSEMAIPVPLPPSIPGLDVTVSFVESLRPDMPVALTGGGHAQLYREALEGGAAVLETTETGAPVVMAEGNLTYVGAWLGPKALRRVIGRACAVAQINTRDLPDGVRIRDCGAERFWFNYNNWPETVGGLTLEPAGVLRQARTGGRRCD